MAEALVEPVVGALLHKVAQEANVVISFKNDFQWLSKKLEYLKGLLRDASGKSRHNNSINAWLHEIEDVAYDAEDICEECLLAESDAEISQRTNFSSYTQFLFRYRMGRRIKDVKDRIQSILGNATALNLVHNLTDDHTRIPAEAYRKKSSLLSNETQRVGMEEKIEMMMNWLNDPETRVIAVDLRQISLRRREERSIPLTNKFPGLRTLLLTDNTIIDRLIPNSFISNLKSLRVLDLSWTGISSLPKSRKSETLTSLETLRGFIFMEGQSGLRIEDLKVDKLDSLEEFPDLEYGAMPCLKSLWVWNCGRLKKRPDGLERLINLEEIDVQLCGGWQTMKAGGEDWKRLRDRLEQAGQI
eukprot:Gb_01302 [translate_table: standard]